MNILYALGALCLFPITITAQSQIFTPAAENQVGLKSLADKYELQYNEEVNSLPSKYKADYKEIYKSRWENIKSVFDRKEVYTSQPAQQYLDAVVREIVKSNPVLKDYKLNCYFSRSGVPNASYIGEGIILFNMGLFHRLDNESEVAFILCHEISHYILKHSENSITRYITTMNSSEVQEELRKIKKTDYGKREAIEKLTKGITFNSRRHSRDHEAQADSMGLALLLNTRFNPSGATKTLAILDDIDKDTLDVETCLRKELNVPGYPFQNKWITKSTGLLGGQAKLKKDVKLEDSLKTHPDCKARIALLEPMIVNGSGKQDYVVNREKFDSLRQTFKYEIVEYAFISDNYTYSLYYTLMLLQQYREDPYLVTQIGRVMNGCFAAQKSHTLGKYIELPAPYQSANYNVLLQFIQNLYVEDFAAISFNYLKEHATQLNSYAGFQKEFNLSSKYILQ
ncbi:Peptidase family M48 [Chitinophaga sp. YR573]|uniref:M48 family metallopeptidase n=1 Tax=Chitinophaga sp. YR573 TaxID=1881040 RepID=UPI0008D77487|nr:M48 family metallopeptidase [Chitinophaga sp. YR573]SEW40390.1 Peptidase family M48 [Chitinophaga sp. YR573]